MIVVVDDERTFKTDAPILYIRTLNNALAFFARLYKNNLALPVGGETIVTQLWLDHDLGEDQEAIELAEFLFALSDPHMYYWVETVFVHSQNPVGAQNVFNVMNQGFRDVRRVPLPELI